MIRINVVSIKQVRESCKLYDVEKKITYPIDAANAINAVFDLENEDKEKFGILVLDTKNKINAAHIVSMGSLDSTLVHPREVFKLAILNNAASIICFHNHPSGDPEPSEEDINVTKRLQAAGKILGIELVDHIIIGANKRYISLKQETLI